MAKFKIIFLFVAFCWSMPLQAYDIDELVKILIDKNENNSAFIYDDQIDDISLENADKIYIPQIDYTYNYSNTTSSTVSTSTVNTNTNTISATINLYNGGFSQLNLISTKVRNQALDFLRQYQKELLIKELVNGYNTLQGLIQKKSNQQKNLNFYQKKVQEAEILFKANRITKTDLLDFQNELISAESLLLDYDRQIDNLMLQVNKLLDMDLIDEDIEFDKIIEVPDQLVEKKPLSGLMNSSYGQYLTYIEQTYLPELEMNKKDIRPSVDLTYSLSDSDKFSNSVDHRRSSSLLLTLSVPIYDGFKDENNFDIQKYEYQKKLLNHKDLKRDLLNTYLESWNNYNFYVQKIDNQNSIIDTLKLKLKGDEILYKSQKISVTRLIETQNDLNNANNIILDLVTQKKYYLMDILILNNELSKITNGLG
ncbi:TolC family protein [Alphaproteobacteria bacterium]|nr:TolC family protein [Alphaproteobacteria bacterium]